MAGELFVCGLGRRKGLHELQSRVILLVGQEDVLSGAATVWSAKQTSSAVSLAADLMPPYYSTHEHLFRRTCKKPACIFMSNPKMTALLMPSEAWSPFMPPRRCVVPEVQPASLLCESMAEDEAVVIRNVHRISRWALAPIAGLEQTPALQHESARRLASPAPFQPSPPASPHAAWSRRSATRSKANMLDLQNRTC